MLTITGTGNFSVKPDEGHLVFRVTTYAPKTSVASKKNAEVAQKIFKALEGHGIKGDNLHTISYSIGEHHKIVKDEHGHTASVKDGFVVTNMIRATVCELPKFGDVIDAVTDLGGMIQDISFVYSKSHEATKEARIAACNNANEKAQTIAKALGLVCSKVVAVTEVAGGWDQPVPKYQMFERSVARPTTPIAGGTVTFSVTVQVQWLIEPDRSR